MAKPKQGARRRVRGLVTAMLAGGAFALAAAPAQAQVPGFDLYLGAGLGQSDANAGPLEFTDIDEKDMSWKIIGGVRFASVFGAELNYIDFGKVSADEGAVDYKGLAAFGMFYVPLPLPVLDLYAKAGLARVDADVDIVDYSTDDTRFAWGFGAQLELGSWALRGEYERFRLKDSGEGLSVKPSMISLSFTKSFL